MNLMWSGSFRVVLSGLNGLVVSWSLCNRSMQLVSALLNQTCVRLKFGS
ncbi:hypothetical protein NSMM_150016 [Nitrosomonas mobilis]|uniref:Uncharacterized protein n=1 Tax=Nitrosomonas mobilis TaxID=51642 RepID=A0A1G5SAY4_9PROT|nr:hypothetical protein NSMM_150016 [Nitrosomonas mobilis]